jgi:hypothetical protein
MNRIPVPTNPFNSYLPSAFDIYYSFSNSTMRTACVTFADPAAGPLLVLRCLVLLPARLPGPNNEVRSPTLVSRNDTPRVGRSTLVRSKVIRAYAPCPASAAPREVKPASSSSLSDSSSPKSSPAYPTPSAVVLAGREEYLRNGHRGIGSPPHSGELSAPPTPVPAHG